MPTYKTAQGLLNRVLKTPYFGEVIPYHKVGGTAPLVVVVGENASGKSFFRRVVTSVCQHVTKKQIECIPLSMEARSSSMMGAMKGFVYGDESYESTGVNSVYLVTGGIKTSRSRDNPHVVFWDEPDLGLSGGYAAGLGKTLCEYANNPPKHLVAAFVVTHSRELLSQVLPCDPIYIHLGRDPSPTLQEWIDRPVKPLDPTGLKAESHKTFKKIQRVLNKK